MVTEVIIEITLIDDYFPCINLRFPKYVILIKRLDPTAFPEKVMTILKSLYYTTSIIGFIKNPPFLDFSNYQMDITPANLDRERDKEAADI